VPDAIAEEVASPISCRTKAERGKIAILLSAFLRLSPPLARGSAHHRLSKAKRRTQNANSEMRRGSPSRDGDVMPTRTTAPHDQVDELETPPAGWLRQAAESVLRLRSNETVRVRQAGGRI
jgi:hypothetical protein